MSKKPVPSKKQSVSSSRSRNAKYVAEKRKKLQNKYQVDICPETGEAKLRHFASPNGKYRGREVFTVKSSSTPSQEIKA